MNTRKQSIESAMNEIRISLEKVAQIDQCWLKFRPDYFDKKRMKAELTVFYIDPKGKETNLTVDSYFDESNLVKSLIALAKVQLEQVFSNHAKTILHL